MQRADELLHASNAIFDFAMSPDRQLNIFSFHAEKLAEAWQTLFDLDFPAAQKLAGELLAEDIGLEEARMLMDTISHWSAVLSGCAGPCASALLLKEILHYPFSPEWGPRQFRLSLLMKVIGIAKAESLFVIDADHTIADLLEMTADAGAAEDALTAYLERHPDDAEMLARLADLQWRKERFADARANYLRALLLDHSKVRTDRIENTLLKIIVEDHGEMAPAWSPLYGEPLPLVLAEPFTASANESQKRVADACMMLLNAEEARRERDPEMVVYRKILWASEPELYKAYFTMLRDGKQPVLAEFL